jgi:hypothetical protein
MAVVEKMWRECDEKLDNEILEEILEEIKDAEWVMVEVKQRKKIVKWDIDGAIKRLKDLRKELEV